MKEQDIISCKIASRLISISFERRLTRREQAMLTGHLAICETCRHCLRQIKALRRVFPVYVSAVKKFTPPRTCCLSSAARRRIIASLQQSFA